jgi:DnaK suppressor protein
MATTTRCVQDGRPSGHARHKVLQRHLEREQHVLRARTEALRESARGEMLATTDVEERSEELVDFSVGLAALGLSARTVQGFEIALRRLEAGKYGICLDCSGQIEAARLRAMPSAVLCRGCQEQYDGSRGRRLERF